MKEINPGQSEPRPTEADEREARIAALADKRQQLVDRRKELTRQYRSFFGSIKDKTPDLMLEEDQQMAKIDAEDEQLTKAIIELEDRISAEYKAQ